MASIHSLSLTAITFLVLLFLTCLPSNTLSQNPLTSPSAPTIAECGTSLLPLASCAPFVQGTVTSPAQPCCGSLRQIYNQQPNCLCLLLKETTLSSFPINSTLALQLPLLCNLQADISTCSGPSGVTSPPSSPASQVSFGTDTNSTVAAASSTVTVAPKPSIMGFGFGQSSGVKLKKDGGLAVLAVAVTTFLWTKSSD